MPFGGYLLFAAGRYAEALQSLQQAGPAVSVEVQRTINSNASASPNSPMRVGRLGFNHVTGRAYLDARILAGDQDAQEWLNEAASECQLGFNPRTGRAYLDARALAGDKHAQILRLRDFYFHFYNAISGL